jgi:hypothetical protein
MRPDGDAVRGAGIVQDRIGGEPGLARRGDDPTAPVAEAVAVGSDGKRGSGDEVIGNDDVGDAGGMDVQCQDHRRRLRAVVEQLVADSELHDQAPFRTSSFRDDEHLSEHHLDAVLRTVVGHGQERFS